MKRLILVIICLLLTGCSNNKMVEDNNNQLLKQYKTYEKKLFNQQVYQDNIDDFSIRLIINKIDDNNRRYDIIIDSPKINMYYLQAIAKVEEDDSDSLPSLGILEEAVYSLIPNVVDKTKGIYKGVNLSGVTKEKKITILVYLTFYNDENKKEKKERFIKLYGDAT